MAEDISVHKSLRFSVFIGICFPIRDFGAWTGILKEMRV